MGKNENGIPVSERRDLEELLRENEKLIKQVSNIQKSSLPQRDAPSFSMPHAGSQSCKNPPFEPPALQEKEPEGTQRVTDLLKEAEKNLLYMDLLNERRSDSPDFPKLQEKQTDAPLEQGLTGADRQSFSWEEILPPSPPTGSKPQEKDIPQAGELSALAQQLLKKAQRIPAASAVSSPPAASIQGDRPLPIDSKPSPAVQESQENADLLSAPIFQQTAGDFDGQLDLKRRDEPSEAPDEDALSIFMDLPAEEHVKKSKARKKEKESLQQAEKRGLRIFLKLFITAAALCTTIIISFQFIGIAIVQGASMSPVLSEKDLVLFSRRTENLQRGDIVIIKYGGEMIVKRIIGVPGDLIEVDEAGYVLLDGERIEDEPALYGKANIGGDVLFPVQVEEGRYFVLGDNRPVSLDSRMSSIGQVPREDIVGEVISWVHIE